MGGQKFSPPKCREVKALLIRLGFVKQPQKSGTSHEKYRHDCFRGQQRNVSVDCPKDPFGVILVKYMSEQAGLSKEEFYQGCSDSKWLPASI